jgi:hypothetical protein
MLQIARVLHTNQHKLVLERSKNKTFCNAFSPKGAP